MPWLLPIFAYLVGSIPFGVLIARSKGVDIRQHGSGNVGATNVFRVVGRGFGISCLLLDFLKGFLPVVLATNLLRVTGESPAVALPGRSVASRAYPRPLRPRERDRQRVTPPPSRASLACVRSCS